MFRLTAQRSPTGPAERSSVPPEKTTRLAKSAYKGEAGKAQNVTLIRWDRLKKASEGKEEVLKKKNRLFNGIK